MFHIRLTVVLLFLLQIFQTDGIQTTSPVSIILNGFTLQTWNEQSLWNKTRLFIVKHLNQFCQLNYQCDAQYGIDNIHLIDVSPYNSQSIRLNITADKPIMSSTENYDNSLRSYNYTALLTNALLQSKHDLERLHDHQSFYSFHQNSPVNRRSRLLCSLGRRHSYSQLLKPLQPDQIPETSPSVSTLNP